MGARWMAGYLDIRGLTHVGKSNLVERCLGAQPILPLTYGFRSEKPHKHTNKHEMHLDTQGHDLKLYVQHNTNNNQGGKRIAEQHSAQWSVSNTRATSALAHKATYSSSYI